MKIKTMISILLVFSLITVGCKSDSNKEAQDVQKAAKVAAATINILKEQANYKAAEAEVSSLATLITSYLVDGSKFPQQNGPRDWAVNPDSVIYKTLVPKYAGTLPSHDPWGHSYEVYLGKLCEGKYGIQKAAADDYLIISLGLNGAHESWQYDPKNDTAGLYPEFDQTKNIVNFNGTIIRGLKK
jgi:hypothetical protein